MTMKDLESDKKKCKAGTLEAAQKRQDTSLVWTNRRVV